MIELCLSLCPTDFEHTVIDSGHVWQACEIAGHARCNACGSGIILVSRLSSYRGMGQVSHHG